MTDQQFWVEMIRGLGIILKALGARYLGKKITINSD